MSSDLVVFMYRYKDVDARVFDHNFQSFVRHNPDIDVVQVNPADVEDPVWREIEGDNRVAWRNCDLIIYDFYRRNPNYQRYMYVEWDTYCTINVCELIEPVKDCDVTCRTVRYPGLDNYCNFKELPKILGDAHNVACALTPLCGSSYSAKALSIMSAKNELHEKDLFCEVRAGYLARSNGLSLGNYPKHCEALRGYPIPLRLVKGKGLWHQVKSRYSPPAEPLPGCPAVGEWAGTHPHWSSRVSLRPDGYVARDNKHQGYWTFYPDGNELVLAWDRYAPEKLTLGPDGFENEYCTLRKHEALAADSGLKKPVDIYLFGIRRSGNHGFAKWLLGQFPHLPVDKSNKDIGVWYDDYNHHLGRKAGLVPDENLAPRMDDVRLISYENDTRLIREDEREQLLCKEDGVDKYCFVILRNPLNWYASYSRYQYTPKVPEAHLFELMLQYFEIFHLQKKDPRVVAVLFDRWVTDPEYRKEIARRITQRPTDRGFGKMETIGVGSSFDGWKYKDKAHKMDLLRRYHHLAAEVREELLRNPRVKRMLDSFPPLPGLPPATIADSQLWINAAPSFKPVTAVASICHTPEIIPAWLKHYREMGVNQFAINVAKHHDGTDEREALKKVLLDNSKGDIFLTDVPDWDNTHNLLSQRLGFGWIIPLDMDEFCEFPYPLEQLVTMLEEGDRTCVLGRLIDRVTPDGSIPSKLPSVNVLKDFPLSVRFTESCRGNCRKIMLVRWNIPVSAGHHAAKIERPLKTRGVVWHVKWFGDVIDKIQAFYDRRARADSPMKRRMTEMLRHLRKHGGINTSGIIC